MYIVETGTQKILCVGGVGWGYVGGGEILLTKSSGQLALNTVSIQK